VNDFSKEKKEKEKEKKEKKSKVNMIYICCNLFKFLS